MKVLRVAAVLIFSSLLVSGCAHERRLRAVEGDIAEPYDDMGSLEVHVSTNPWKLSNLTWNVRELFTLGFADTSFQRRLKHALAKKAKKHFDVDQVINVTYWPDPDGKSFPKARVFARGQMVRYKKFPVSSADSSQQAG